jgi:hypothetical protein
MTSLINRSVIDLLMSTDYDAISTTVGLAAVAALILLLIQRESVRASGGRQAQRWIHALDIAVLPLLASFAMIILVRLLDLLPGSGV